MRITVINLATRADRWAEARRRFESVGLLATRQEAIAAVPLAQAGEAGLYSAVLNRRTYHKPLRPGEIGCYASHLQAWERLLASDEPAMAVFEDDVEFDADLPEVLAAIENTSADWELLKLMGREREKIRASARLDGKHRLIDYRRVPSFTGAYVVSRRGAEKLLATRRPFGRPVDVDLRHWWECDLDIKGVHPYPVRTAPSSAFSSIGGREVEGASTGRLKKPALQARYTFQNWLAVRRRHPGWLAGEDAEGARASPPARQSPLLAARARTYRRNLVIVRAGDASLHRQWIDSPTRDFDLFISYYGQTPSKYQQDADHYERRPGPKWPCIADLVQENAALLANYQAFWFPDDDLSATSDTIDRMFAFFCAYRLCLAQPALTRDSYFTWDTLLQDPACHIRYNGFVEVMAPIFSRAALAVCAPTFSQSRSGWGLDWVWPGLCRDAGLGRIAILDATPVRHTRPVGGELYRNHPELDPRADASQVLRHYGIEQVRAVAKYSFEGQVRDVAYPLPQRVLYFLKRLNGRRKHRAPA